MNLHKFFPKQDQIVKWYQTAILLSPWISLLNTLWLFALTAFIVYNAEVLEDVLDIVSVGF